jgi:hypothetical protein
VGFELSVVTEICEQSGIEPEAVLGVEDSISTFLIEWYLMHRDAGREIDPVAEELIEEVRLEDKHGGGVSHQPGTA